MFPRQRSPEVMDRPGLPAHQRHEALRGLARLNFLSGSASILWQPLLALARRQPGRPLRVLDLATGAGDVPLRLGRRARKVGIALEVAGCDVSPVAVDYATNLAAHTGVDVRFFVHDVLCGELPSDYDAVVSSLFLHHLEGEAAADLLRRMAKSAKSLVLVNDLARSWPGLVLARVATRLLSTSPVVHVDGPRSVEGAFTRDEVRLLAQQAGLSGATVERRWPCRYLLSWERT